VAYRPSKDTSFENVSFVRNVTNPPTGQGCLDFSALPIEEAMEVLKP